MKIMAGIGGIGAYQQTSQVWNQNSRKIEEKAKTAKSSMAERTSKTENSAVKTDEWKPINTKSSLVPTNKDGIGMAIGDVELSDKAKDYYSKLKAKFGNMQFIAVSGDMKEQVKANAAAYGNANKMVVLIDDAKIEQMANDESFRKKYEGIIAMSQSQMAGAKNSLVGSGANIKNFGMSVNSDGSTSFFATVENSSKEQAKRIEKKQAEKKAAKAMEKKEAEKKAREKRLEKAREDKKVKDKNQDEEDISEDKEYVKIEADSMDELINKVSKYAYGNRENSVMTEDEKKVGQKFDFEV